jgi:hypothetical protein
MIVAACTAIAVFLYPVDCDAAFAVHDAIWYGVQAENNPTGSISPHHPLFHVFVGALVGPLRGLGVEGPGHVATRVVAGLGASWLLLQICALAGRNRVLVGAVFALVVLCTRGFIVELGAGENVLPAAAAALFALTRAARPDPSLLATGAALTFAALMRQDNVFMAPGVAAAVAMGLPEGRRLGGLCRLAGGVLLATAAGYGAAWLVSTGGRDPVAQWLTKFGQGGAWTGPATLEWSRLAVHAFTISQAMTGRIAPDSDDQATTGLLYLAAMIVPGILLRGSSPHLRLGVAMLVAVVPRAVFYAWYEADNFEWVVLPVAFAAAFGAGLARGEPVTRPFTREVGAWILVLLASWLLAAHGPYTWRLRERTLMTAVAEVARDGGTPWRFLVWEAREGVALYLLGHRDHEQILQRGMTVAEGLEEISRRIEARPVPTVVIADRFVMDGMPYTMKRRFEWVTDWMQNPPNWEIVRKDGRGYAARYRPPDPDSRAESRR